MTKISSLLAPVKRRRLGVFALLAAAFFFRLWYGTCSEFWRADEKQIFLIGLKSYTTRTWPWFGPDVGPTPIQMPGALQGLMVALPFFVAPVPEAPFVLLNLLSFASLCFLAWYCRHQPVAWRQQYTDPEYVPCLASCA